MIHDDLEHDLDDDMPSPGELREAAASKTASELLTRSLTDFLEMRSAVFGAARGNIQNEQLDADHFLIDLAADGWTVRRVVP